MIFLDLGRGPAGEAWRTDPFGMLFEIAAREPGKRLSLRFGDETILLFQDATAAKHIGRDRPDNYNKNFGPFEGLFGRSRLTTDGDRWQRLQRLSQPYIAKTNGAFLASSAAAHFSSGAEEMLQEGVLGPVAVDVHLNKAAAAVIAGTTLGFSVNDLGIDVPAAFHSIFQYASLTAWNLPGAPRRDDPELFQQAREAGIRLKDGLARLASRQRTARFSDSQLLKSLAQADFDDVDLFGELCTLLFAGFDTSAAALGWAMWLLAGAPDLQDRLRRQIREICADRDPTLEEIGQLSDLAAFQSEALRIFPPIPMLSRVAQESDEIDGTKVEGGQRVLLSIVGLHHDSHFFQEPRRVSLQRFPAGEVSQLQGHLLPFGTGRRGCPGQRIATTEIGTALVVLLQRLEFRPATERPLAFSGMPSLRRRGGHEFAIRAAN
jgi:cytochrome P450